MFKSVFVISIIVTAFLYLNVFALENTKDKETLLYKKSIPLMMEIIFEFANDDIKNEILTLFKRLTGNDVNNPKDFKKFTYLLRTFLYSVYNKDKKILDKKLIDDNPSNDKEIKEVIIPKLQEFKKLLSDKDLKIKNIKKYEMWSNKIKKQIFLINSILDMLTINKSDKDKIRKLLEEIQILIENKRIVL